MSRIETLTPAQIAKFPEYVEKWTRIGLSCEPCDYEHATTIVTRMYEKVGMGVPLFVLCDSPLSAGVVVALLKRTSVSNSVSGSVWDSVWDSVGDRVRASVRDSVWARVWDSVSDSVRDSVWASVGDSVSASVRDSVRDSVRASVGDSVSASVSNSGFGSHDAGWLSYYHYFRNEVGIEKCHDMDNLFELASVCGWWTPYKDVCVLQHRHNTLNRDEQGLLHCPDGYAVGYRDGWGVYAWHGVRVPEQVIIAPKTLTPKQIEQEENTEVRRVMVERFGQDRFLVESGAKAIHADEFGTLYRKEVSGDEPIVMVKVINSTPEADGTFKDYFLRVPPDITKAREAVAWTADMTAEEYEPLLET